MTPEQKATKLLDKMLANITGQDLADAKRQAKKCALICVEEILDLGVAWFSQDLVSEGISECDTLEYWEAVKSELQNL